MCLKWNWQKVAILNKLRTLVGPMDLEVVPLVLLGAVGGGAGAGGGRAGRDRAAVWRVRSSITVLPSIPQDQVPAPPIKQNFYGDP